MEECPGLNVIQLSEVLKFKWCHYTFLIMHKCTKMSHFFFLPFQHSLSSLSILSPAIFVNWPLSGELVKFLNHYMFFFLMLSGICHIRLHKNGRNNSLSSLKIYIKDIIIYFILLFIYLFIYFFLPQLCIHLYDISRLQTIFLYYCLIYKSCGFCFFVFLHF